MPSLYNAQLGFVHVPKTGGSWVYKILQQSGIPFVEPNEPVERGGHFYWHELPTPFRFGFVRHPATWYRSYWTYVRGADWPFNVTPLDRLVLDSASFDDFVKACVSGNPGLVGQLYDDFLGRPGDVEFIGRYEQLSEDLERALTQAGVPIGPELRSAIRTSPKVNESRGHLRPEISPELHELIAAAEQETMERFGYAMQPA